MYESDSDKKGEDFFALKAKRFMEQAFNKTCSIQHEEKAKIHEDPLWKGMTFHHFGLIISATFGSLAIAIALFLIWRHASHFLRPWEQIHIIRILAMIPIYALVSFLSYLFYRHSVYFEVVRDCYEAFAISSFFTLLCHYIAPNLHEQKEYFRRTQPKNWVWPLNWTQKCTGGQRGCLRKPRSGLTWFNIVYVGVYQYCFIRPFFTLVSVIAQANHRYCYGTWNFRYLYPYISMIEALSVTIAMYCLIQFYVQLKDDLAHHRPFLKVLCIKLVIFFCFWQSILISFLSSGDDAVIKASKKVALADIKIGIPAMLVCVEMSIFAIMHLYAFPWSPYDLANQRDYEVSDHISKRYAYGPLRAILAAMNPWDIVKAIGRGFRWLFYGVRHRKNDASYQTKLEPMSSQTGYQGPTFAGNGEPAMEVGKSKKGSIPVGNNRSDDSDTIGLLSHPQANPYVSQNAYNSAYGGHNGYSNPDSLPSLPSPGQVYGIERPDRTFETQEPIYSGYPSNGMPPPNYHEDTHGRPSTEWDMFAGTTQSGNRAPTAGPRPPGPGMI